MRVLFLDIDTLRPDHMSCYGYRRTTTPNLDRIAAQGTRFDGVYCSDAPCLPSRAALVTGMFGLKNGAVGHGGTAADRRLSGPCRDFSDAQDQDNFHFLFRKAGMHCVSISSFPERHSSYWFVAGFHETYNVGKSGIESGEEVVPLALDWLGRKGKEDDWYMHLHLWDPHTPYRTPADFENPFADDPLPEWITPEEFARHQRQVGPHGALEISMYDDRESPDYPKHPGALRSYGDVRKIFDGYDGGVYYADLLLGQVLSKLQALGVYEDTAVIVTSDHGEALGELGIYGEHATADVSTCRIPLLIKWPGCKPGQQAAGFHYLLDLVPTVAELLGVPKGPHWDGLSFANTLLRGEDQGRESLVLSQMAHVCQRSARFGRWLYLRTVHDGFHLFDDEMLFDIESDPYEQQDVKAQHPDICAAGAKIILDWQEAGMKTSQSDVDPMWTVMREGGPYHTWGHLAAYCEHLRTTGRAQGAEKLLQKHGKREAQNR